MRYNGIKKNTYLSVHEDMLHMELTKLVSLIKSSWLV